ncbi:hypothetical protein [Nostocoides sp. Soil756]|uniref:hypothetical protein n=1 Tax=Nostocoides sp. Soil756 TaxID=1736399 RepID=UPI000ACD0B3F|nr:hypothetical protein [Tetrasphaera sp. Soil756]
MTTRGPQDPQSPSEGAPPPADETAPLEAPAPADAPPPDEPVSGAPSGVVPPVAAAAPTWMPAAGAPPPGWGRTPGPAGPVRRAWDETRATRGGRVALAAIGVLSVVLLVALIGLGAALVGDRGRGMAGGREGTSFGRDQDGPGRGDGMGRQDRDGQGRNGMGRQDPNGQALPPGHRPGGNGQGGGPGNGTQQLPGMGAMGGALGGLGAVLHGEFTTSVTGTPAVMVVQSGQVTAYTPGTSLSVKSTDGFSATYVLDGSTIAPAGDSLAVGSAVRVLAAKQGMKAVLVVAAGG